ncbi:unnamed protein product [Amoebophrya sp. A120]|nr:unnamed protein product [Amoebophrya sp. A120]|eukprot:GSA120T00024714001.1
MSTSRSSGVRRYAALMRFLLLFVYRKFIFSAAPIGTQAVSPDENGVPTSSVGGEVKTQDADHHTTSTGASTTSDEETATGKNYHDRSSVTPSSSKETLAGVVLLQQKLQEEEEPVRRVVEPPEKNPANNNWRDVQSAAIPRIVPAQEHAEKGHFPTRAAAESSPTDFGDTTREQPHGQQLQQEAFVEQKSSRQEIRPADVLSSGHSGRTTEEDYSKTSPSSLLGLSQKNTSSGTASNASTSSNNATDSDDDDDSSYPPGSTIYHHGGYIPITEGDRTRGQHVIKFAPVIKVNSDNGSGETAKAMNEALKMLAANMGQQASAANFAAIAGGGGSGGGNPSTGVKAFEDWKRQQKLQQQNQDLSNQIKNLDSKLSAVRNGLWGQHTGAGMSYGGGGGGGGSYGSSSSYGGYGSPQQQSPYGGSPAGGPLPYNQQPIASTTANKNTILSTAATVQQAVSRALQQSNSMAPDCVYQWQRASVHAAKAQELARNAPDPTSGSSSSIFGSMTSSSHSNELMQAAEMVHMSLQYMKKAIACVNWNAVHYQQGMASSSAGSGGAGMMGNAGGYSGQQGNNYGAGTTMGANYYSPTGSISSSGYATPSSGNTAGAYGGAPPGAGGYQTAGGSYGAAAGGVPPPGAQQAGTGPGSEELGPTIGAGTISQQTDAIRKQAEQNSGYLWTVFNKYWLSISYYFGNLDLPSDEKEAYERELLDIEDLNEEKYAGTSMRTTEEIDQELLESERGLQILYDAALIEEEQLIRRNGWYFLLFMLFAVVAGVAGFTIYKMHRDGHAPAWIAPFLPGGGAGRGEPDDLRGGESSPGARSRDRRNQDEEEEDEEEA